MVDKKNIAPRGLWARILSIPIKTCFTAIGCIVVSLLMINNIGGGYRKPIPVYENDKLTVVINTFERHDMMEASVNYYLTCPIVKYINIVWSENGNPPEDVVKRFEKYHSPKISFERHETDSLNNRFQPLRNEHSDAIFNVDDDMKIPCDELTLGYHVWRNSPKTLVGFMPRVHVRGPDNKYIYRCWWRVWWHGHYSIILTKAAYLHHDFFDLYTNHMPKAIHEMVDRERNCEDIAMQFLVSNVTSLPPIYVKGHLEDEGVLGGISTRQNVVKATHMDHRSECLNKLIEMFGRNPLVDSHYIVDTAANGWTNEPADWWEYISSDLWNWY